MPLQYPVKPDCPYQRSEDNGPQVKYNYVFLNTIFWSLITPCYLYIVCGCFHAAMAELHSCDGD